MATFSESGRITDTRSGGKIVQKTRRRPTTPYDCPPAPPQQQPKSPNWLTSVIFPATRRIASGAAKIFSMVFDSDNSDYSSSHSSSDSETANDDNDFDQLDDLCDSEKDHGVPSEAMQGINETHQLSTERIEKTHAIEKLLMQESYSREDCDRLTQIINSRVMDSTAGGVEAGVTTSLPDGIIQTDTDDICSKAITEARKWLKEKKLVSSPLSDRADASCGLESVAVQHIDNDVASPLDIAKTYMRSRPPWASPFGERVELQTPSTLQSQVSREGTLFPAVDQYLPSFNKKRKSLASGSWNIQEEIRRVRQKATEDLLQSPSKRIDFSSLASSPIYGHDPIANLLTVDKGDKGNESTSLTEDKQIYLSMNDTAMGSSNDGGSAVGKGNGSVHEFVMSDPTLSSAEHQDSQAIKIAGEYAASIHRRPVNPDLGMDQNDGKAGPPFNNDPLPTCVNGSLVEELRDINETHENGLPTSQASTLAEVAAVDICAQKQDQNPGPVKGLANEKTTINIEKCELSEASIEVPIVHGTDCITNLCQSNSITCQSDDSSGMITESDKSRLKPDAVALKQEGKKMGRYNRRSKGRAKS